MEKRRSESQLTRKEQIWGLIFFALYFLVFPPLKMVVEDLFDRFFGLYLSEAMSAMVYYYIIGIVTVFLFRGFLKHAWNMLMDLLPENLTACAAGAVGAVVLRYLMHFLPYPVQDPNPASWAEQFAYSPAATAAIVVVLMPLIEEVLFRGLVFGSLRPYSRGGAWLVSVLLFMLYSVWTFAVAYGDVRYLTLSLQYLPAAAALTWCYDRGGSIWTAVVLHAALNAAALFQAVH